MVEPARIVHQVGATERRAQAGEGSLGRRLAIGEFGVGASGRAKERQPVVLGELGHGRHHQIHLGRAVGEHGRLHIHHRGKCAVDKGRTGSRELGEHQPTERFRASLHDLAGKRGRCGAATLRRREVDEGDTILRTIQDLFHSRVVVQQGRDRLRIVHNSGGLSKALLAACDQKRHLVDVTHAADILAAKDQRLFGVREHLPGDHPVGDVGQHIVGHADRHHPRIVGQCIGDGRGDAAVVTAKAAPFVCDWVQVIDAVDAGPEPDLVTLQKDRALAIAAPQHHARRRLADRLLDHPPRQAYPVSIHPRAPTAEYLHRPWMCDLDAGALQHLQRRQVDLFNLLLAQHRQPGFEAQFRIDHGPFLHWCPASRRPTRLPSSGHSACVARAGQPSHPSVCPGPTSLSGVSRVRSPVQTAQGIHLTTPSPPEPATRPSAGMCMSVETR